MKVRNPHADAPVWECHGFADLLPSSVAVEQAEGDPIIGDAWPAEAQMMARALPARRVEFTATRQCARRALGRLGYAPRGIASGAYREPIWPRGIVGSLTHCGSLRAAAVAPETVLRSLGIDAEPNEPLPQGTLDLVTCDRERAALRVLSSTNAAIAWGRVAFSAKEAIFKAWFPITRRWLDFTECDLSIDVDMGTFRGRLRVDDERGGLFGSDEVVGRWGVQGERVLTAVYVEASSVATPRISTGTRVDT